MLAKQTDRRSVLIDGRVLYGGTLLTFAATAFGVSWEWVDADEYSIFPLAFMPDTAIVAGQTLAALAVVALLAERANEVFIANFRSVPKALLEQELADQKRALTAAPAHHQEAELRKLEGIKLEICNFANRTRILTMMFSMVIGLVIAVAGVRALSPLFDIPREALLGTCQGLLLELADIFVTASLISGGASGIHKIISALGQPIERALQP